MGPCLAAAVALTIAVQQPTPGPRFKSSADLVQVDVSVVDRNGRPIRDLTAGDFELRVDGRRRPIVSAQFVAVGSGAGMPSAPAPPERYSSNADAAGGRLIMIVVDRGSIAAGRGEAAFEAASQFLGGLHRADRVALASIPDGPQADFTANHALVQQRLRQVNGAAIASQGPRSIGIADALAFERKDQFRMDAVLERECGVPASDPRSGGQSEVKVCLNQVTSEAAAVVVDARDRAHSSILGLQALLDRLTSSATPKMLVFISEGLVIARERAQLSWLGQKAAAAHVTLYALHLMPSEFDASQRRPPASLAADRAALEDGLAVMAQATRGDVFRVVSNSDFAFRRLALELSGYYLLGFEPDATDRNGRAHFIKVDVRRAGVTVRSRQQFTIDATPVRTAETEIVAALRDPLPSPEIPIKLTTYSFRDPQGERLRLLVAAEIDRSINPEGRIAVGYVLVDFDGKLAASQLDTTLPASARRDGQTARYFSTVLADPGKYTLKLAVVDDAGRRGSVERVVHAALKAAGPVRVTDLLVASDAGAEGGIPLAPAVSGDFTGGTLHGYLELFADAPETLDLAAVTLEVAETETSPALERVEVPLRAPDDDTRCRIAGAGVSLAQLPPGNYVARAVIAVGGRTIGQVTRPFSVTRAEAFGRDSRRRE
jgi:VWFA-related protein